MSANGQRVLMAGEFWFGASADGVAVGFRKLGWDVCQVEIREHFNHSYALPLRLAARLTKRFALRSYNEAILAAARNLRPRAFVTIKGLHVLPETLAELKRLGVVTVNYYPDVLFAHDGSDAKNLALYDCVATTKAYHLEALTRDLGVCDVRHVPHGYSSHVHYPRAAAVAEADYTTDCLYVGIYSPYKFEWLAALRARLPQVSLTILGNGWREAVRGTALESCFPGYYLLGDTYARALQTARINLAVHYGPVGPEGWEDAVSTRTFEIPACKGFMLHIDNAETRSLFGVGEEIDVFADHDELADKVAHYLAQPELRAAMIERAYARAVPAYSYDVRAAEIARAFS